MSDVAAFARVFPKPLEEGNINLFNRPHVRNADGSYSSIRTISIGTDRGEVLIPTVSDDGRILSTQEAIKAYRQTGRHFGVFPSIEAANAFAELLHRQQASLGTLGQLAGHEQE